MSRTAGPAGRLGQCDEDGGLAAGAVVGWQEAGQLRAVEVTGALGQWREPRRQPRYRAGSHDASICASDLTSFAALSWSVGPVP